MHTGLHLLYIRIPMLCKIRVRIVIKTESQNFTVVSKQEFHALSDGALFFCYKSHIMYRKMEEGIHKKCGCIQLPFSVYINQFTGKQNAPFEITLNSGLETIKIHNFCSNKHKI